MTPEEGQNEFDEWFNNLPVEIDKLYTFLSENVKKFQTFDLLSCFAYYNHLHDSEEYSDFRDGKNFFVSEVLALLCLKSDFVTESSISRGEYLELIIEMQEVVLNYCLLNNALLLKEEFRTEGVDTISDIANALSREARQIRNSGLPEHHFIFVEKLFEPIKDDVRSLFGFTVSDSISIRKHLLLLINNKCKTALGIAFSSADNLTKEILEFRKTKTVEVESVFTIDQLEEYSILPDEEIKHGLRNHVMGELFFNFKEVYTFTSEELADYAKIELESVRTFLSTFSCGFPSLTANEKIYEPITILKSKPLIENNGLYLLPSFPLIVWAVEDEFERAIMGKKRLNEKYPKIKHEFLLEQGLEYFKLLLPTATIFQPNLFYYVNTDRCETDGLIIYDQILFIIEAKGNRITQKAKQGHELKTQDHLKGIVKESYNQGIRTLKYIDDNGIAEFKTKNGERVQIDRKDFDDVIIVSLTLEPVGNIAMSIKATNELGYFNDEHFPWIISIYDLVVLVDLFENPIMLIHYVKRRKKFLSQRILSIYEELDLVSYFLNNGLYIEDILSDAKEKEVDEIEFVPDTDAINDFYMYKFGHKTKLTGRPRCFISEEFNVFLLELDRSKMPHRVRMALLLLEFDGKSIDQLMNFIKKTKERFSKDSGLHDCSIYTKSQGGIGVTFMTGRDSKELDYQLFHFCANKVHELNLNTWIGFGDVSTDRNGYSFQSFYFSMKEKMR